MKLMMPTVWTDALVIASNITEPDTGEVVYNPATTYAAGDLVYMAATHKRYKSRVASNTGNAVTDDTKWQWVGSTNRWGMFDQIIGSASNRATPLTVTVSFSLATTVVLLGLVGVTQVTLTHQDSGGTNIEAPRVLPVAELFSPVDWYEYFFTDPAYTSTLVATSFAPISGSKIIVSASAASGLVSVGTLLCGTPLDLGPQKYGVSTGYKDYSTVTRDADTGLTIIKSGPIVKDQSGQIVVRNEATDGVMQRLRAAQSQPVLIIGDGNYESLIAFGRLDGVRLSYTTPALSYIDYKLEELT